MQACLHSNANWGTFILFQTLENINLNWNWFKLVSLKGWYTSFMSWNGLCSRLVNNEPYLLVCGGCLSDGKISCGRVNAGRTARDSGGTEPEQSITRSAQCTVCRERITIGWTLKEPSAVAYNHPITWTNRQPVEDIGNIQVLHIILLPSWNYICCANIFYYSSVKICTEIFNCHLNVIWWCTS